MSSSQSLSFTLIRLHSSTVISVPLISAWCLTLTLSIWHLQGGHPIRRLRQGPQTRLYQGPPAGPHLPPRVPRAPRGHGAEESLLQQNSFGVGDDGHPCPPPHGFPWAHVPPWVRRPLNPWLMQSSQDAAPPGCYNPRLLLWAGNYLIAGSGWKHPYWSMLRQVSQSCSRKQYPLLVQAYKLFQCIQNKINLLVLYTSYSYYYSI